MELTVYSVQKCNIDNKIYNPKKMVSEIWVYAYINL